MVRQKRTRKTGPIGGLGVRYGRKARKRYGEILSQMREKHICPQCISKSVRRESVGIWVCSRCGLKFAGGAYVPTTKVGITAGRSTKSS